ncbi:hypothetical protein CXQ85_003964 [Candidozyma haemuli]|uniref:RanBD1 domain-containing protein n=1 Tax=Candidozyma haemuli TaxID=45357 RepID=A0A2V1B0N4_9ASCO|nr:hypothetical protein CXQ85_003964 [[Candida] haemuloni]PVH23672.1 hypothetical protein CXQ85_003964 [[Candida] haemuloni]
MVKRTAERQIRKDESPDDHDDGFEVPVNASADVLAKRRILQPKGRSFSFPKGPVTSGSTSNSSSKILALNKQFKASVLKAIDSDVLDLRPLVSKYLQFYKVAQDSATTAGDEDEVVPNTKKATLGWVPGSSSSLSASKLFQNSNFKLDKVEEKGRGVETTGPSFTFNKNIDDPVFKVGHSAESGKMSFSQTDLSGAGLPLREDKIDIVEEDETEGNFKPVVKLSDKLDNVMTGEENESTLFSCKTKVFLYDSETKEQPYKNVGIGELKVLKAQDGKSRVLVRAEGSSRVILNALLVAQVSYITTGSNVKVPVATSEGSIKMYLVRVKTQSLAEELCSILNNEK